MSTKHYPFYGGSFDRIIFDGDGSVWVPESENAKLRDEIDQWHRLTAGIELPEYPITEFQPKDLERENTKLRELVQFANKVVGGLCEIVENSPGCFMCQLNQDDDRMCGASELYDRMRELGVDA